MTKRTTTHKRKAHAKPERGFWLSFLIAVVFIRNIAAALAIWGVRSSQDESTAPWMVAALGILALADVVSAVAMWFWKRWGFYLFLISSAATGIISLILTGLFYMLFHAILPPAFLGYIMRMQNKWEAFD